MGGGGRTSEHRIASKFAGGSIRFIAWNTFVPRVEHTSLESRRNPWIWVSPPSMRLQQQTNMHVLASAQQTILKNCTKSTQQGLQHTELDDFTEHYIIRVLSAHELVLTPLYSGNLSVQVYWIPPLI